MDFISKKIGFFLAFVLAACTAGGGGPLGGGLGGGTLDATGGLNTAQPLEGGIPQGDETAATPDRQGSKIDLDPQDMFFPVLVPNIGGPYIFEDCFHPEPGDPQCKYISIDCEELPGYTVEYHPQNPDLCRIHEIIMIWGDCTTLKFCNPLFHQTDPSATQMQPQWVPDQAREFYSGKISQKPELRYFDPPMEMKNEPDTGDMEATGDGDSADQEKQEIDDDYPID